MTVLLVLQLRPPADWIQSFPGVTLDSLQALTSIGNGATTGLEPVSALVVLALLWWFWQSQTLSLFLVPVCAVAALSVLAYHRSYHEGISALLTLFALWVSFEKRPRPAGVELRARRAAFAAILSRRRRPGVLVGEPVSV